MNPNRKWEQKDGMNITYKIRTLFAVIVLCGCSQEEFPQASELVQNTPYEAHCKEPLPVFTLGRESNPTKAEEEALCSCIWESLDHKWEREMANDMKQGISKAKDDWRFRGFMSRFGDAISKCGGMEL